MTADDTALAHGKLVDEFIATRTHLTDLVNEAKRIGNQLHLWSGILQNLPLPQEARGIPPLAVNQFDQNVPDLSRLPSLNREIVSTYERFFQLREQIRALGLLT